MPGPPPKENRRRRNAPARGEWQPTPGIGWQHGPVPTPPDGLKAETLAAWETWFAAWFASHWIPADLPGLRLLIGQFDAVQRGANKANEVTALMRLMDSYGITPAGQNARRWQAPKAEQPADDAAPAPSSRYSHLRAV